MSTGSAASDADDYEASPGRSAASAALERTARKVTCYDPGRAAHRDARQSQRNAANARERARMRVLSKAFSRLKTSLPWVPADTKLSKLDTLRLASSYISHLRQLLQEDRLETRFAHPVSLTWPFMMTGRPENSQDISSSVRLCGATA
ncbi:unnamed protein product [Tetraodon nigroviridis]|uniref:(spotted green pufferfish) hypothetical protein n=1 Tax=Tetraodon nigroviridis TaxID=99883 RepID=Q4SMV2_TETNG|nr:unnamed protein product [Tetraodon nigroviridis]